MNESVLDQLRLSIIVPTEGRVADLGRLVASLLASWQAYIVASGDLRRPEELVEFVIVDSTDPPHHPGLFPGWDVMWMRIVTEDRNVRRKRNRGVHEARGEWIAFIDSDCVATEGYLPAILAATADAPSDGFAGRVSFSGAENFVWRLIALTQLVSPETQTDGAGEVAWCATANLIIRRSLFLEVGGFDETLPFRLGGDDVDFGLRLRRHGKALRLLPAAAVIHPKKPWSSLKAILPRAWRWGRVEYHLSKRHPELVRQMPPAFHANLILVSLACVIAAVWLHRAWLLALVPAWATLVGLLSTWLTGRGSPVPYYRRYLAGWMQQCYRVGTLYEYLRHGSARCFWEGLILEDQLDMLFPGEPLDCWSQLMALALVVMVAAAGLML